MSDSEFDVIFYGDILEETNDGDTEDFHADLPLFADFPEEASDSDGFGADDIPFPNSHVSDVMSDDEHFDVSDEQEFQAAAFDFATEDAEVGMDNFFELDQEELYPEYPMDTFEDMFEEPYAFPIDDEEFLEMPIADEEFLEMPIADDEFLEMPIVDDEEFLDDEFLEMPAVDDETLLIDGHTVDEEYLDTIPDEELDMDAVDAFEDMGLIAMEDMDIDMPGGIDIDDDFDAWAIDGDEDFVVHDYVMQRRNGCDDPSILPVSRTRLAWAQEVRWNSTAGHNGPAMNCLGCVDGRVFIASQNNIIVYENGMRVAEKSMPARINNLVSGHGPLGASLAVTCDNGQVSLLKAKPLEVVHTWRDQQTPAWGLSMHSGAVATGSNDHNVRVFLPPNDPAVAHHRGVPSQDSDEERDTHRTELDDARRRKAYRTLRGHTGNLPCVVAWDNYVLSGGLDGSLALWDYDHNRRVASRHHWMVLWGCARIPLHALQVYRGTSNFGNVFGDHSFFELPSLPAPLLEFDVLPFLTPEDLRVMAQVRSRWIHVTDAELSARHRTESVILCVTNSAIDLMDGALDARQHYLSSERGNDFAFVAVSEIHRNRLFIARKARCVLQVSLFRLFNSDAIAMRVDALSDLPPSYGLCVCHDMLYGVTEQGSLWRANLVEVGAP